MRRLTKKLNLNTETVRRLGDHELVAARGGQDATGMSQQGGVCPSAGVTLCPACNESQRPLC